MNNIVRILLSFLVGVIGGSMAVYTGVGVSLMVPLVLFFDIIKDYKTAVGTMFLAVFAPITSIPVYNFYKSGNLDIEVGISVGLGYFVGSYVTSTYFINSIKREVLYLLFGLLSLMVGCIFIKKSKLIF
jgi:uncharacterized membrane protein YfcA